MFQNPFFPPRNEDTKLQRKGGHEEEGMSWADMREIGFVLHCPPKFKCDGFFLPLQYFMKRWRQSSIGLNGRKIIIFLMKFITWVRATFENEVTKVILVAMD